MTHDEYEASKAILDSAPKDGTATHYASNQYLRDEKDRWNFYRKTTGWNSSLFSDSIDGIRSLNDIRDKVAMYEQLQTKDNWIKEIRCAWHSQNKVVLDALLGQPPQEVSR